MMKLILAVSDDDPAFKPGGILADRTWLINDHIAITVKSGFDHSANGFRVSNFGPKLNVHARNDFWQHPDFRENFDVTAFEIALGEAKEHVTVIENYIREMTERIGKV